MPPRPVILRGGVEVADPLSVAVAFVEAYWHLGEGDATAAASFGEPDLRLANRGGARVSAAQIAAVLERRAAIEAALAAIPVEASLAGGVRSVPWIPLWQLFDAFAGVGGVGYAKVTKALHPKRPALIPMLDSVVQRYLEDDDPGAKQPFGDRAIALVRGYRRDLRANRAALGAVRRGLARRGYEVTEVRILDVLIWSVGAGAL